MSKNQIYVTEPSLAPLGDLIELLKGVWERKILTHNGPLVQQFERELCKRLGLNRLLVVSNGTIAIQMAIKALQLKGEIITTPFTWIATLSAIKWEGCTPIFCDIENDSLNIDPKKILTLITNKTVAIMPVHVFGNPCDIMAIEEIAKYYKIKVIYDAAHAVGSTFNSKSILEWGDVSATSFHATKLLNTAEGGGCVTKDEQLHDKLKRIRFFGHDENKNVIEDGFNAKMTEIHAALGLVNIKLFEEVLLDRKKKYHMYKEELLKVNYIAFQSLKFGESNYSYFPIIFETEKQLKKVERNLNASQIFPRRYFYPSVNTFTKIVNKQPCPVSEAVSKRILCLPLYWELSEEKIAKIIRIIKND